MRAVVARETASFLVRRQTPPANAAPLPENPLQKSATSWPPPVGFSHCFRHRARADHYCASVAPIVICVSPNVRPPALSVSRNFASQTPMISRQVVDYCAPLQLPSSRRPRTQTARPRATTRPRDNQRQQRSVAPRQPTSRLAFAAENDQEHNGNIVVTDCYPD